MRISSRSRCSPCSRSTCGDRTETSTHDAASRVDRSPSGRPSSRAFSRRRMILPLLRLREVLVEGDGARSNGGAEPAASEPEELEAEVLARPVAGAQRHERLDDFSGDRIGHPDDAGLDHRRVLHHHALDLERTDEVAGGLDHVVGAADEPQPPVGVAAGDVSGEVPATGEARGVALARRAGSRGTSTASPDGGRAHRRRRAAR